MKLTKYLIIPERKRYIHGGFAFIPNKFLFNGYLLILSHKDKK